MHTTVYLVRHTQTIGNVEKRLVGRTDFAITKEGEAYIEKLTKRLENVKFDMLMSSTSGRAIKTIEPIGKMQNLEIFTTDELCEMSFGEYDGLKWDEVNELNPKISEVRSKINEITGMPGQETTKEVADRMYNFIQEVCSKNEGKTILMSSHGIAIEAFIKKINNETFMENKEANSQKNTSINIIDYDNDKKEFTVLVLNDYKHIL